MVAVMYSVEERLDSLEKQVARLARENRELKQELDRKGDKITWRLGKNSDWKLARKILTMMYGKEIAKKFEETIRGEKE